MASRGPLPRFADLHVKKVLELLSRDGRMSRKEISVRTGLGEGSVRTILRKLKQRGLVSSTRAGHFLTEKGRSAVGGSLDAVEVSVPGLTVGRANVAVLVRGASHLIKKGIEQRDEAIKAGAGGATVLVCRGGRLEFPEPFMRVKRAAEEELMEKLRPREGDVVIIGTADNLRAAEEGARAAARSLRRLP
jgi:DNA-binding Lrp family transcriptional regulator